jgi:hypothetical protein
MEMAKETHSTRLPNWVKVLINLLPLWFVSLSITTEGFPKPPISLEIATASFATAVLFSIILLLKRWMEIESALYSFTPLILLAGFDEISTTYKTPFIFASVLILTVGALAYQYSRWARPFKWLILLVALFLTLSAAGHAAGNFWQMASDLGYKMCFPDYHGCGPLTGNETPWWVLFLRI